MGTTKYLFFDTETTGLPRNYKAPVTDLNNWPRLVQLAYVVCDEEENEIIRVNQIIKPQGFTIPEEVSKLHGITHEKAIREGIELSTALTEFANWANEANFLVAHNISFDEKIMGAEFIRNKMSDSIERSQKICTMQASTDYCRIPGPYGYKWPNLQQLHTTLFGLGFGDAHNAAADVDATLKCFFELKRLGEI